MRYIPPATHLLAPIDVETLRELLRRRVPIDAPAEPDVPLRNLNEALQRAAALQRIRRAARSRDVETFWVSIVYLAPADMPEAWHCAYAFRDDLHRLAHILERIFVTALAHREGWATANAVCEDLVESKDTRTSFVTTIERGLRDLLKTDVPLDALISSFGRWRQNLD
jgi:hypothetical protein